MKFAGISLIAIISSISSCFGQWQGNLLSRENVEGLKQVGRSILERLKSLDNSEDLKLAQPRNYAEYLTDWLIPTANYLSASEQCLQDSNMYAESLAKSEGWALKMYDASGKTPDGLASYNIHAFGHFEQCLKTQHEQIFGKYCTAFLQFRSASEGLLNETESSNAPRSLFGIYRLLTLFGPDLEPVHTDANGIIPYMLPSIAFCLPSSCSAADIGAAIADKISRHPLGQQQIVVTLDENYCFSAASQEEDFDAVSITVIVVLSLLGLFLFLGTAYDAWHRYQGRTLDAIPSQGIGCDVLLSFSILTNGEKILSTRQSADSLPCLHGIRFFSMTWVVLGHVWMLRALEMNANPIPAVLDTMTWPMQAISNATPSVDTFFFLSGLLVAYIMLRELDKRKGAFNPFMMYLHRYLRLTPVYAIILAFLASLSIYVGTGPFWQSIRSNISGLCREYWWVNLLYINNFYEQDLCMGETWYLANDMQMFLLAPFFVYALWKWPQTGLIILGSATVGFIAVSMAIIGIENLPPTLLVSRSDLNPKFNGDYYIKPYTRIPPYLVGIFVGYVLYKTKAKKIELNYLTVTWGWIVAIVGGVSIIYGMHDYLDQAAMPQISKAVSVIYGSVHRAAFVACIGWVIFACTHGYGGFVNTLLSWKGFLPLSRLTYCTYLIHLNWLAIYYARIRIAPYYTILDQTFAFVGHLVFSMGLAFIVSTCAESPFLNLEKLLFSKRKKSSTYSNNKVTENIS